jgi:hypothetical protein
VREGLITVRLRSADCRQCHANGDHDEFGIVGRYFGFGITQSVLHVRNVADASVLVDGRVVSNLLVVITEDQRIDTIGQHGCLIRTIPLVTNDVTLAQVGIDVH